MKKTVIMMLTMVLASFVLLGCEAKEKYVKLDQKNFPDYSLYSALKGLDYDQDSKLSQSEIEGATSISLYWVEDLTGLDAFTNLETIYIANGKNLNCDFNNFTNLKTLRVEGTFESNRIDLSGNTNLESIYINSENLEELVLPEGAPLKEICIESTLLKGIDLNSYKGLTKIEIESNELMTELSFQDFPELTELTCSSNLKLNDLNVSNCPKLKVLECAFDSYIFEGTSSNLTNLDISDCENIEEFRCRGNKSLTSLNLSSFPKLTELDCSYNNLTKLDISRCPELTKLSCVENTLTSLDLSSTPKLNYLACAGNSLNELDVSCCPDIETLVCWSCNLTNLNFEGCSKIGFINCQENKLSSLDISGCPEINGLYCGRNALTSLDISKCPKLVNLINTTGSYVNKDGDLAYRDEEGKAAIYIDKDTEIIK